ncbi:MAG: hypothetical protein J0I77_16535 [Rudaea sp.]|uniref:hypothetical protein n=1 Tax=unclassified Rudaea TaxID=2627037 RepID=UPI0014859B6A|nr:MULTISPECIES: hypothetical protein [unclassified Rudaea]MBN8887332.1 hypothetical protein [Rudaea sp.]MBR0343995.1 hypothetical protein [Rudaea sp.]
MPSSSSSPTSVASAAALGDEYRDSGSILVVCATGTKTTDDPDCSIDASKRASI